MALTVAQLAVKVGGDTAPAEAALNRVNEHVVRAREGFGGMLKGALGMAGGFAVFQLGALAMSQLTDQIHETIAAGEAHQNVLAETANTIQHMGNVSGQTTQSIADYAESMGRLTGIMPDTIQHAENVMLTFADIGGNVFPEATTAALNMATMLKQDVQSSVVMVGKALNDPLKGLTALSRVGVSFTEQEKQQIKTMMAHNDIAGAQGIIMGELNKQFGGAAETAGKTFSGGIARAKVSLEEMREKIFNAVLPVIQNLAMKLMPLAMWLMDNLPAAISVAISFLQGQLFPALANIGGVVGGHLLPAVMAFGAFATGTLIPALISLAKWIGKNVLPVVLQLGDVIVKNVLPPLMNIARAIMENLVPPLEKIWSILAPRLVPVFHLVGSVLQNVVGPGLVKIIQLIGLLLQAVGWVLDKLSPVIGFILDWVNKIVGFFVMLYEKIVGHSIIPDLVNAVLGWIQKFFMIPIMIALMALQFLAHMLRLEAQALAIIRRMVDTFLNFISGLASDVVGRAQTVVSNLLGVFTSLPGKMLDIGGQIIDGLKNGLMNKLGDLKNAAGNVAGGLLNGLKGALGIHSPSQVMAEEVGRPIIDGMAAGILKARHTALSALNSVGTSLLAPVNVMARSSTFVSPVIGGSQSDGSLIGEIRALRRDMLNAANKPIVLDGRQLNKQLAPYMVDGIRGQGVRLA